MNSMPHSALIDRVRRRACRPTIALVVPSLELSGGVPAVADFVYRVAERSNRFDVRIFSLSASMVDDVGLALTRPQSWLRGVKMAQGLWRGRPFTRIGAFASELEFQRYRPRPALATALAGCDLFQVVCGSAAWANTVLGLGRPVAIQVATRAIVERRQRDARPSGLSGWWRKAMTQVTNRLDDRALRHVDAIQVENPWMLEYSRGINSHRSDVDIRYAPPGVDGTLFQPLLQRDLLVDPYVLCVGRFDDPRKRIELLLESYARLPPETRRRARLVLAGAAGPTASFWVRADELGLRDCVQYIASPDAAALVSLYQHSSAFALPSDEEGLGVVVLEAMACGIPVVSTRSGGPDGIISDGEDGFLVPLDSAKGMAERLNALLTDPQRNAAMGRRARETIVRRYEQQVAGEAFLDMWDALLRKGGPH